MSTERAKKYCKVLEELTLALHRNGKVLKDDERIRGKFLQKLRYLEESYEELSVVEREWIDERQKIVIEEILP